MPNHKVLIITSSFPNKDNNASNGYFVYELANKLSQKISVDVLCPHSDGLKKNEQYNNVQIIRYQYFFSSLQTLSYGSGISENLKKNPLNYFLIVPFIIAQFFATIRQLKKKQYDLVHIQWLIPQGFVYALVHLLFPKTPPFIITSHGSDINKFNRPYILIKIKKWAINKAFRLITVSKSLSDTCLGYGVKSEQLIQIPTGIETQQFYEKNIERNNDFLYVGRLIEQKGLNVLLESFLLLHKVNPLSRLTIIGDGYLSKEILTFIHGHKLSNNIELTGIINHKKLTQYYNTHKFLIAPSIKPEGLGLTVIEAMACGCIPIASDIPALNEIISHKTGFIIPPNNASLLSKQMSDALNEYSTLKNVQQKAINEANTNYSWETIADKHLLLYTQVIEANK